MQTILVVDDERAIRNTLKDVLELENFKVDDAVDGIDALAKLKKNNYDLMLCDIKMPQMDGLELLQQLQLQGIATQVIVISGHGNIETAVEAVKKGAFDFIQKPLDLNRLLVTVRNALDKKELVAETKILKKKLGKSTVEMIGNSAEIKKIIELIERVAPTEARVLITGSNGTGKELVARSIHEKSNRNNAPLIEVNCAAIPSELIESELFGHEKGAFTSAIATRKGKFEQADGGTIFLDEIGDMSLSAQAKVLRALQENKITKVGGDKEFKINVRVIAATNKDLKKEIEANNFREDLYHRLNVIPIHVPSLAERKEDIPVLAEYFVNKICDEQGMTKKSFTKEALKEMQKMPWTGNIREFKNVIERLIILCDNTITDKDVVTYTAYNR
jgi:DNA-binding NtrC family response regulator